MSNDPPVLGFVVASPRRHEEELAALGKEVLSALRALKSDATTATEIPAEADCVVLLVEPDADLPALPDLRDRAATAIAVAADGPEGRAAVVHARKRLRQAGAVLGPKTLVVAPDAFGHVGLESDAVRERLHILLHGLVHDAERLRLRREGWEEPDDA